MNNINSSGNSIINQFLQKINNNEEKSGNTNLVSNGEDSGKYKLTNLNAELEITEYNSLSIGEKISSTIFKSTSFNLEAAFKDEMGNQINLSIDIDIKSKTQKAMDAYAKSIDDSKIDKRDDDYYSPEKTAQRIVDFAAGFLNSFKTNHSEDKADKQINDFYNLALEAIDKGFSDAQDILGALYGEKAEKTQDITHELLSKQKDNWLSQLDLTKNVDEEK